MELDGIITKLEGVLADLKRLNQPPVQALSEPPKPATEFDQLKVLLNTWPWAVDPSLICDDSENNKTERGRGIVDLLVEDNLKDLDFLDYGCGEGHSVLYAQQSKAKAVGYDAKDHGWAGRFPDAGATFTTKFEDVAQRSYDVILCFDTLDHLDGESPVEALKKMKAVLKPTGRIYLRFHPWTSRHATHVYRNLNKAYAHIVFSPEELNQLAPEAPEKSLGVKYPLREYGAWINEAGLKIVNRVDHTEPVEDFFKNGLVAQRILKHTGMDPFPEWQLSLQFVDYILSV